MELRHPMDTHVNKTLEFINQKTKMINDGYSREQIRSECLTFVMRQSVGVQTLDRMIHRSMELYAEIILKTK